METKKTILSTFLSLKNLFRHPRNWGARIGVYAFAGMALLPASLRDPVLGKVGRGRALG